jgi:hypothetical protein
MLRVISASCHAASDRSPFSVIFVVGCRHHVEVLRAVTKKCVEQVIFGYRSERSLMLSVRMGERIERKLPYADHLLR